MRATDPLDTYLLRVLCGVVTERSVSRTALRLNQTQPAISVALKRLREIFGDPLLVREKAGMVPTERALQLVEHARVALAEIDKLLGDLEAFDPYQTTQTFKIGSPDYLASAFMADIAETLRRDARKARLLVHALGPEYDFERALANGELDAVIGNWPQPLEQLHLKLVLNGELDVVIGNWPQPPEQLHLKLVLEDDIVCLVSKASSLARKGLTQESYLRAPHVVPMPYSLTQKGVIDTRLATLRVARDARVVVQSFNMAPYLLPGTDLVFTTSRHFAQYYANLLPLAMLPAPIDFPRMRFYQLWHDRTHRSPAHSWFRGLVTEAGRRLQAESRAVAPQAR